jgi:hypothetical protein
MIISASRRTDIPAFYAEWFLKRLRAGFVLVRNPLNFHQVSQIPLVPKDIECLVFWTKNPAALLCKLPEIDDLGYRYYFLFTLTPYDCSVEVNVPAVDERIRTFQTLAKRVGCDRVLWRYDPILFTDRYTPAFHIAAFAGLATRLAGFTKVCIISFVEMYRKCARNMRGLHLADLSAAGRIGLIQTLQEIGAEHSIALQTCAAGGLDQSGIKPGKCIDDRRIAKITGFEIHGKKDKNQRRDCGCIESIDIGTYNSCPHNCLYCYANNDQNSVAINFSTHKPDSPLLCGTLQAGDKITPRVVKPLATRQRSLF